MSFLKKSLVEVVKDLKENKTSSVTLTKECIEQIKRKDGKIGAILYTNEEKALEAAAQSDERRKNNRLLNTIDGVPVAIKDMILSVDFPSTAASKILEGYVAPYDATVTKKLKEAGAVILGKNNQDEFAMGSSNENSAFKPCYNPWNLEHTPGGSSGGSAACVSAAMAYGSLGTDTGGSIRQPAAFCGITGLKPTYGRVSRYGVIAFASSLDQVGPMARTVEDCAAILSVIAGYDEKDSTSAQVAVPDYLSNLKACVKGKKVGVPKEYFTKGLDDSVQHSVNNSIEILRKNGAEIVELSMPNTKYAVATYYIISAAEASSNLSRYDGVRYGARLGEEKGLLNMYEETRGRLFGEEVKRRIVLGTFVLSSGYYDAYYAKAQKVRRLFANDFKEAFSKVDFIISPTTPTPSFKVGEKNSDPLSMYLNDIYTISANLAGICGISLPCGFDNKSLPIGVQLMGKAFDEQVILDASYLLQNELNINKYPPIVD